VDMKHPENADRNFRRAASFGIVVLVSRYKSWLAGYILGMVVGCHGR
jgi:hypothetical protein